MNGSTEVVYGLEAEENKMTPKEELDKKIANAAIDFNKATGVAVKYIRLNWYDSGEVSNITAKYGLVGMTMEMK